MSEPQPENTQPPTRYEITFAASGVVGQGAEGADNEGDQS